MSTTAEHRRLADTAAGRADWQRWGPYVSDRAWGTVREDYSADGTAWDYFPHDHARSRAYRWNEDGLAGFCDRDQVLCLGLALWNREDAILKERLFGLSNREGNHGEDVKEHYFYLDNTPTHAYARMLYKYPQVAFPYAALVGENAARDADAPEFELVDAVGEALRAGRYFDVTIEYAKAGPEDILCRIEVVNRGPDPAPIHVMPHLWYRNTWSWHHDQPRHAIHAVVPGTAVTGHPAMGERWWHVQAEDGRTPPMWFTENDTNTQRLFNTPSASPYVKDGINDAVVYGQWDRVNRERGSKVAADCATVVPPGRSFTVHVRLAPTATLRPFARFAATLAKRRREADEFYAAVQAPQLSPDERLVQRQAFAGLLWSKQFYHYDVRHWLEGDPAQPPPPAERWHGRNRDWALHFHAADVVLMPDKWEYPWFASWDLAFQAVVMAELDPAFAKAQIALLLQPGSQHPYGAVPAFEWDFNAANPPIIAWAVWQIYLIERARTGTGDIDFLRITFEPLLLMLGWWLNRKDSDGRGIFSGGFLGLDNIGIFDRDRPLPTGGSLEQGDATGWMAMFHLNMAAIAFELAVHDPHYQPMVHRFGQDFVMVTSVLQRFGAGGHGLWDDDQRFYFDAIRHGQDRLPLRIYSMVGLVPLFATSVMDASTLAQAPSVMATTEVAFSRRHYIRELLGSFVVPGAAGTRMLSVLDRDRLRDVLGRVLDESQFLSDYGVRSLSRAHAAAPYTFEVEGQRYEVSYQPGVSNDRMFGGNSNWRGPIWFPMNFLLIQSIATCARYYGDDFRMECPTGSGRWLTLAEIADDLASRLTGIFVRDGQGRRAVFGDEALFQDDPHWRDHVPFHEFFHGDSGAGLGASHQTGWTALVALLLQYRGRLAFEDTGANRTAVAGDRVETPELAGVAS
jgi:hypothetical protein